MLKEKISEETYRYLRITSKISLWISVVVIICISLFGSTQNYNIFEIFGLFLMMMLLQFLGILSSMGFIKLTNRTLNKRQVPFL